MSEPSLVVIPCKILLCTLWSQIGWKCRRQRQTNGGSRIVTERNEDDRGQDSKPILTANPGAADSSVSNKSPTPTHVLSIRTAPLSRSKLEKDDGDFDPLTTMIGFLFNGIKQTVRLPSEKAKVCIREAHAMLRRKIIPLKVLQTTVGQLQHAAVILPTICGCFITPLSNIM